MAEYLAVAEQTVPLNQSVTFIASIPCTAGNVFFENGTGVFTLRGKTCNRFARYNVDFNGNVAIPTGGAVTPIAVAISTPAAVDQYNNVTSTATIDVPAGCCVYISLKYVSASADPTVTPTPVINVQNGNLRITRVA